jgi:Protein of unknown function (DUF642)
MKKLVVGVSLIALAGMANASSLIVNGSFESPDRPSGTWGTYSSIPGWTSTNGIEIRDNAVGQASQGTQFVELDTNRNSSMSQSIATQLGHQYRLSYDYSPRIGQPSSTNGIAVYWNNLLLSTVTATGGGTNLWMSLTALVVGTGNDVLRFAAIGTSDSLGGNLDNVALNAVPLPAAAWLFGSALLGAGALRRKQQAAKKATLAVA